MGFDGIGPNNPDTFVDELSKFGADSIGKIELAALEDTFSVCKLDKVVLVSVDTFVFVYQLICFVCALGEIVGRTPVPQ